MSLREDAEKVLDDSERGMHGPTFVWEQTAVCQAKRLLILLDALEDIAYCTDYNDGADLMHIAYRAIKAAEDVE